MFCNKCGNQIQDDDRFCPYCGAMNQNAKVAAQIDPFGANNAGAPPQQYPQHQQQPQYQQQQQRSFAQDNGSSNNTYALIGFILAFFVPILGLIFSIMGVQEANKHNGDRKGLAIAGIIISAVWMVIAVIGIIIYVAAVMTFVATYPYYCALPL